MLRRWRVMSLPNADKYRGLTRRPSQEQKGLDERTLIASQQPFHPLSSAKIDFSRKLLFSRCELQFAWEPIRFHSRSQFSDASSRSRGLACDENDSRFRSPSPDGASGL